MAAREFYSLVCVQRIASHWLCGASVAACHCLISFHVNVSLLGAPQSRSAMTCSSDAKLYACGARTPTP